MQKYVIKNYQDGFEQGQARIGREVARNWVWPYAYDLEGLLKIRARADFDPDTRHYCFLGDEMVGYMFSTVSSPGEDGAGRANLDFPRMLPGHEPAAELLIDEAFRTLLKKGVSRVDGRVTSMCPGDIQLAIKKGFLIRDWGYKVYYSYETAWGKLEVPAPAAEEIDPEKDLGECAELAAKWYQRPAEWCRAHLEEWHAAGIITHAGVREGNRIMAACMAARNEVRPATAAIYYIYTPDTFHLKPMLVKVVNQCVDAGVQNVIADLINEHRPYEPVYQELGFKKAAEWARCEKVLA